MRAMLSGRKETVSDDRMNWHHVSRKGICMAAAGLFMMGVGVYRGEMSVVLEKAINICMECIGIG